MKKQSEYDKLIKKANREIAKLLRGDSPPGFRFKLMKDLRLFQSVLKQIEADYPKAVEKEILTLVVNRMRHSDVVYRDFIRHNKSKKQYAIQFIFAMDRMLTESFGFEFIFDEVARQICKKVRYRDIDLCRVRAEIHSTNLVQHMLDLVDAKPFFDFKSGIEG
jgi:hypothetical protein